MSSEEKLLELIDKHLDECCNHSLSNLRKYIDNGGRETARATIFSMCKNEGIGVQLAMSNLDSELG